MSLQELGDRGSLQLRFFNVSTFDIAITDSGIIPVLLVEILMHTIVYSDLSHVFDSLN